MNLEETIYAVLCRTGFAVYLYNKPQGVTLPKIVYQRITKVASRTMSGRGLDKDRFQVSVWSTTYTEGKTIADLVVTNLDLNKTDFILSYLDSQIENKEVDTSLYQIILDFIIYSRP